MLFSQGISDYEPLRRERRERLEELRTGDGRPLPQHLKAQIGRELDRLELILQQIRSVETERDALLSPSKDGAPAPGAMLKSLKGIGPEFAGVLWSEGLYRQLLQSTAGRCLCGVGADALAKRVRRSRTGRLQSREPAAANNDDTACLAVGETSAGFDTGTVVPSNGSRFNGGRLRKVLIVAWPESC